MNETEERLRASAYGVKMSVEQRALLASNSERAVWHLVTALQFARDGCFFYAGEYCQVAHDYMAKFYFCKEEFARGIVLLGAVRAHCQALEMGQRVAVANVLEEMQEHRHHKPGSTLFHWAKRLESAFVRPSPEKER